MRRSGTEVMMESMLQIHPAPLHHTRTGAFPALISFLPDTESVAIVRFDLEFLMSGQRNRPVQRSWPRASIP